MKLIVTINGETRVFNFKDTSTIPGYDTKKNTGDIPLSVLVKIINGEVVDFK